MVFLPAFPACREIPPHCFPIKSEWYVRDWLYYRSLQQPVLLLHRSIIYSRRGSFLPGQLSHPTGDLACLTRAKGTPRSWPLFFPCVHTCGREKLLCCLLQTHPCRQNNQECRGSVCSRSGPCDDVPPSCGHLLFFSSGVEQ